MKSICTIGCILLSAISLFSCRKSSIAPPVATTDSSYFNTPGYKLTSYTTQHLASANYMFQYDSAGRLQSIDHANGLYQYKCFYKGKALEKIIEQSPFTPADTINYLYKEGLLSEIQIIPENRTVNEKMHFGYDAMKRVININWYTVNNNQWTVYRQLLFTYLPDNNISTYKNFYNDGAQLSLVDSVAYSLYDNKINPRTNFFLRFGIDEHFVYIPYVKLQVNNPGKEFRTRGLNTFIVDHHYIYNDNLPVRDEKNTNVIPAAGASTNFTTVENYTYKN